MTASQGIPFDPPPVEVFRVERRPARQRIRIAPVGELDLATVQRVEASLREVCDAGFRQVILDLSGLTFMDSSGLTLVLEWDALGRQDGFDFVVVPGPPCVQRLFDLCGVVDRLPFRSA
jgi:anti-sigma B factor antagonist